MISCVKDTEVKYITRLNDFRDLMEESVYEALEEYISGLENEEVNKMNIEVERLEDDLYEKENELDNIEEKLYELKTDAGNNLEAIRELKTYLDQERVKIRNKPSIDAYHANQLGGMQSGLEVACKKIIELFPGLETE